MRDRADLERATTGYLRRRTWLNPDLRLLETGDGPAVAKDWHGARGPLGWYGRFTLAREWRLLEHLDDGDAAAPIPRPLARVPDAIVLTFLEGETLSRRARLAPDFFDRFTAILDGIHAAGVLHLDLRQRQNVLVAPDGSPRVLDFGAAMHLGRWGAIGRWLVRRFGFIDRWAVLKLKSKYAPEQMNDDERRRAVWARRVRWTWPPNWFHGLKTRTRRRFRAATSETDVERRADLGDSGGGTRIEGDGDRGQP